MLQRSSFESIDSFISMLQTCTDFEEVISLLQNRMSKMGFERSAYWLRWPSPENKAPILLTTYPKEYVDHYIKEDFAAHDMVGKLSTNSNVPFGWRDIERKYKITGKQKQIFYESSNIGLREGASIPIHGPRLAKATFSIASDLPRNEFEDRFRFYQHEIHILATAAHEKLISLGIADTAPIEELTDRETEVLLWVSRGQNYGDVADRLFIQEDTIKKHMQNIFRKLNATNRPHAVAIAIIHGFIIP